MVCLSEKSVNNILERYTGFFEIFQLDRTDTFTLRTKFPEILVCMDRTASKLFPLGLVIKFAS